MMVVALQFLEFILQRSNKSTTTVNRGLKNVPPTAIHLQTITLLPEYEILSNSDAKMYFLHYMHSSADVHEYMLYNSKVGIQDIQDIDGWNPPRASSGFRLSSRGLID